MHGQGFREVGIEPCGFRLLWLRVSWFVMLNPEPMNMLVCKR